MSALLLGSCRRFCFACTCFTTFFYPYTTLCSALLLMLITAVFVGVVCTSKPDDPSM
ncbi:hypothetical protein GALMADRAFT_1113460 [Galerina marginata CBS 339.88]|uniref:Uncharacterized protein n=1 Tax=Galerina marginata (strain CBS 339.88) TaxID=685588 RepID=A0A067TPK3_GALM3|nr:hypothetical protein GALMADRAFT_1113460 [Galerina marginata CBS 339.88]